MDSVGPTAAGFFGAIAEQYDSLIRRAVPRYDEMTDRLLSFLPPSPRRILELGCGTGNLTLRLLERFPHARITAVDAAAEMTRLTAQRAALDAARLTTLTARFEDLPTAAEPFDLVTSCMSLHHVVDKAALYRAIAAALAPGGEWWFADQVLAGSERSQRLMWAAWLRFCRAPGRCTRAELRALLDHAAAHDHYAPLREHIALLERAGFHDADCVWRIHMYAVIGAALPRPH